MFVHVKAGETIRMRCNKKGLPGNTGINQKKKFGGGERAKIGSWAQKEQKGEGVGLLYLWCILKVFTVGLSEREWEGGW